MKRLAMAMAIGALMACSDNSPTAPTPPANVAGDYSATITASSTCSANLPAAASASSGLRCEPPWSITTSTPSN